MYKVWNFKEKLASNDVNELLMAQTIARFDSAGERDGAIIAPATNQYAYVTGVGLTRYNGTAWITEIAATVASLAPNPINFTTFYSTWVNYGGSYEVARYFKTDQNIVHVEGMLRAGTSSDGGEYALQLPTGYRPSKTHIFSCYGRQGGLGKACQVTVDASLGRIYIAGGDFRLATLDWVALGGIQFLVGA